ncbi:hypothetical protein [Cytobacillus kochii]|uniref:hypothetical protein n=1 Tax=Cytobacillus kochii TaxID=859143 RepID=UPI002040CD8B|nr:hypothetical protein [Cytobacillus kochii]MCM3321999.1 hypothetical protein [Cytobacillus kochii]MCM3343169.1 hypothetical protein [Cytobacillus kochii]
MKLIFPAYLRKIAVDSRSKRLHHAALENIRVKCANNMNDIAIIFSHLGCLVIVTFFIFACGYMDLYIFAFTGKKNPNIFKPFNRIRMIVRISIQLASILPKVTQLISNK